MNHQVEGAGKIKKAQDKLTLWLWCSVGGMFLILMIVFGAMAVYLGVKDFLFSQASQKWPSTSGRVISSNIKRSAGSSGSRVNTPTYSSDVRYAFTIDGQVFKNNRISFGEYGSSDETHAQGIVRRYPVGKTVTVYYKQDDPSESVLELGGPGLGIALKLLVGPVFVIIGIGLVVLFYRAWKKTKRS